MYAHRNEDIVNFGPTIQGKEEASVAQHDGQRQSHIPVAEKRRPNGVSRKENASSAKDWKKREFSLLAQFMGMKEIEFSKWLLAAAPSEREKVLQDYKKRKKKIPNG